MPVVQAILVALEDLLAWVAVLVEVFRKAAFAADEVGEVDQFRCSFLPCWALPRAAIPWLPGQRRNYWKLGRKGPWDNKIRCKIETELLFSIWLMTKLKLIFDTNICIDVANGVISESDWDSMARHIRRRYKYCISWVTWKELLQKLSRGQSSFWCKNVEPLRILRFGGPVVYLEKPPLFAARYLLGIHADPRTDRRGFPVPPQKRRMRDVLEAILRGADKETLRRGLKRWRYGFDLDRFDSEENQCQQEQALQLQGVREGTFDCADPLVMSVLLLKDLGLNPTKGQVERLNEGLDASHRYQISLCTLVKNENYDPFRDRRLGNWDDSQQLMYLCDPSIRILTLDSDFRNRTQESVQANQILTLSDL